MAEPAAVRQLTTALAFAYPVLAHFASARSSPTLTIVAVGLLAGVWLLPHLLQGRPAAWLTLAAVGAACGLLSRTAIPVLPLYAPPVLVPAFLACVFGRTLLRGRTPLISQLVRTLQPPGEEPDGAVWSYARRLTAAWTALFVALAVFNLLLAALAVPDGLLLAAGVVPRLALPQAWWSLCTNFIEYVLVAALFAIEYAYRRQRFPQQPYRNMVEFFRRTRAALPQLIGRAQ